jgi:LVIVD repeat
VPDILPPSVTPDTIGCHDTGVLPAKDLAVAACLGAWAVLDISDPVAPRTLGVVQNPLIELDHSAQLTWDGKYAVIGDEHAGAAGGGGCSTDQRSPVGAMWFYDITDPANPVLEGSYSLPRVPPVDSAEEAERFRCTTHNYMVLPMGDPSRYVAVSPYYSGGLSVVDFSTPSAPRELGYYLPQVEGENPDMWSGYWYRGRIYTNEHASQLGVSVFAMDGLGTRQVRDLGALVNPQTQVLP